KALPGKALTADADAVANGMRRILNKIQMPLYGIDDDDAGRLLRSIKNQTLLEIFRKIGGIAVIDAWIDIGRRGLELKTRKRRKLLSRRLDEHRAEKRKAGPEGRLVQSYPSQNFHPSPGYLCI